MNGFGFATALAFACAGWAALSMGMDRHYADMHGRGVVPAAAMRRRCRAMGVLALAASFAVGVVLEGWSVGAVFCLGTMTAAAIVLVPILTYAPRRGISFGRAAGMLALLFGWAWFAT